MQQTKNPRICYKLVKVSAKVEKNTSTIQVFISFCYRIFINGVHNCRILL